MQRSSAATPPPHWPPYQESERLAREAGPKRLTWLAAANAQRANVTDTDGDLQDDGVHVYVRVDLP